MELSKATEKESAVLGEKLSSLRRKQGMSQQDVADLLSVSRQTISNWESDQGAPALDKAAELARIYHVALDDLVSERIEVVTASAAPEVAKDLHVLRSLVGSTCQLMPETAGMMLETMDEWGRPRTMRILDADGDWIRVEYERAQGVGKKEKVTQLIDVNVVGSITVVGDRS